MSDSIKPILKWAGGKRQMLPSLSKYIPKKFGTYIEPFIGGGALFFELNYNNSIISDSNEELINLYKAISKDYLKVSKKLEQYKNTKDFFYKVRDSEPIEIYSKAARTIYLNRTCFNGLYRVNKKGEFNVPYANNKKVNLVDKENLKLASKLLKKSKIILSDYQVVLEKYCKKNDLIFLDPPYLPISKYSDFKRYTKEQFYFDDHVKLAKIFKKLDRKGCYLILTNSNSPEIHKLYKDYNIEVVSTKRNINSKGNKRTGEDIIVSNYEKNI